MKTCIKCNQTKDLSEFSEVRTAEPHPDTCRKCSQKEYGKRYRQKLKELNQTALVPPDAILTCTSCKVEKRAEEFNKSSVSNTGRFLWCRQCTLEQSRKKQEEYKEEHGIGYGKKRSLERMAWFRQLKSSQPCIDCGTTYDPVCMDYDHLRDKKWSVAYMVVHNFSTEVILQEVEKCELICLLCHNKRTYERQKRADLSKYSETQKRNVEIIKRAKEVPCASCGVQREGYNMQFDHIDPKDKFRDICQLKNFKTETLLKEIDKCQVICAMCHRRQTSIGIGAGQFLDLQREKKKKRHVGEHDQECTCCHIVKGYDQFTKHAKSKNGYNNWCRACTNEYKRHRRAAKVSSIDNF